MIEVLYKSMLNDLEFQDIDQTKPIDISSSIFKINSDSFNIVEVYIDNKKLKLNNKNQCYFNIFKVSNNKFVDLKVIYIKENREREFELYIPVKQSSCIYNENIINSLENKNKLFIEMLKNIKSNEIDINVINMKKMLCLEEGENKDYESIIRILNTIYRFGNIIISSPKVDIKDELTLVNSNKARKITNESVMYFSMHPETWHKEGVLNPKPVKILTETFNENIDIYENRLVKYVFIKCKRNLIEQILYDLKSKINSLNTAIINYESSISLGDIEVKEEKSNCEFLKLELQEYIKLFTDLKSKFNFIIRSLDKVKYKKNLKIKMTQKILYDKRYFSIFKSFNEIINKFEKQYGFYNTGHIFNYYNQMICLICILLISFLENNFMIENVIGIESDDEHLFDKHNKIRIEGSTLQVGDSTKFFIEAYSLENEINKGRISFGIQYKDKQYKSDCIILFGMFNAGFTNISNIVNKFYNVAFNDKTVDSTYIFPWIDLDTIPKEFLNERLLFKLCNLGNNFVEYEDYNLYGNYKKGIIPFSHKYFWDIKEKLCKLIRLKNFEIGNMKFCTRCLGNIKQITNELFVCSNCGRRISVNKCRECGQEVIKFLSKNSGIEDENIDATDYLKYHMEYDIKSRFLGACYNNIFSDSGGFCSNCGSCLKYKKSNKDNNKCIKCRLLNKGEEV